MLDESGGGAPRGTLGGILTLAGLIIIFGGCDNKGAFCADLQVFNIEANRWMQLAAQGQALVLRHLFNIFFR